MTPTAEEMEKARKIVNDMKAAYNHHPNGDIIVLASAIREAEAAARKACVSVCNHPKPRCEECKMIEMGLMCPCGKDPDSCAIHADEQAPTAQGVKS